MMVDKRALWFSVWMAGGGSLGSYCCGIAGVRCKVQGSVPRSPASCCLPRRQELLNYSLLIVNSSLCVHLDFQANQKLPGTYRVFKCSRSQLGQLMHLKALFPDVCISWKVLFIQWQWGRYNPPFWNFAHTLKILQGQINQGFIPLLLPMCHSV